MQHEFAELKKCHEHKVSNWVISLCEKDKNCKIKTETSIVTNPHWRNIIPVIQYYQNNTCTEKIDIASKMLLKIYSILETFILCRKYFRWKACISEILPLYREYLQCKFNISEILSFRWKYFQCKPIFLQYWHYIVKISIVK